MSQPPPPPPPPPSPVGAGTGMSASEARNWAMGAHLSAFLGPPTALLIFVGPLVVWLIKREEDAFVAEHAREALNFNLSVFLYLIVGTIATFVLGLVTFGLFLWLAVPVGIVATVGWAVLTIMAAVAASDGRSYRYPLTIRFVT